MAVSPKGAAESGRGIESRNAFAKHADSAQLVEVNRVNEIKICGLTREEDVDLADALGADFLGFIVYPKSPRGLSLERAVELSARVPIEKRVLVDVETDPASLQRYHALGFGAYQIHARSETGSTHLADWSATVGKERLWYAPRLAPEHPFPAAIKQFAETVVVDTYSSSRVGGTGATGDWGRFLELTQSHPEIKFVLAGGLNSENALEASAQSSASRLDFNSGVESEPGIKDPEKLRRLFQVLRSGAARA